jgi:hypothetical protein
VDEDVNARQRIPDLVGDASSQLAEGCQLLGPDQLGLCPSEIGRYFLYLLFHLRAEGLQFLIDEGIVNGQACLLRKGDYRIEGCTGDLFAGLYKVSCNGSPNLIFRQKGNDDEGMVLF